MKFRKIAWLTAIGVFALAGGILAIPGTSHASTTSTSAAPPTSRERYAAGIRAQFGLESDLPYIRNLEGRKDLDTTELGTPVTPGELTELHARRALGFHVSAVQSAFSAEPSFAGTWLRQAGDGTVVALTGSPTAADTRLASSALPAGSSVEFVQAPVSYSQLNTLYQQITAAGLSATGVTNVAIDTEHDTVKVGVATQPEVSAVYAQYGQTGLTVSVAPASTSAVSRNFTSGPLYGGEWVSFSNGTWCTMGYGYLYNAAGQLYSMTAGHCGANGNTAYHGKYTSDPVIGGVHDDQTVNGGTTKCDCEFVGPITNSEITNKTYVSGNSLFSFSETGNPYVGEKACHSGAASYESNGGNIVCGQITSISANTHETDSATGISFTLEDAIEWSGSVISGDSGAPVGDGVAFLGMVSSTDGAGHAWFTKANTVTPATGSTIAY